MEKKKSQHKNPRPKLHTHKNKKTQPNRRMKTNQRQEQQQKLTQKDFTESYDKIPYSGTSG